MELPGGRERPGRVLAGDGLPQGDLDHGGRRHGAVLADKDAVGGPLRNRGLPGRDGGAGDGDAQAGDGLRAVSGTGPPSFFVGPALLIGVPAFSRLVQMIGCG